MTNEEYWARRFKQMEDELKNQTYDEYVKNLEEQYEHAIRELETQMRAWYQRFAKNNGISYSEAQRLLTKGELEEFKWTVQEYIKLGKEYGLTGAWAKELENASARVHVSRLDSLKFQLRQHAEELSSARIEATKDASMLAYTESYYHTAFEVQRGLGVGWSMQSLNRNEIEKLLSKPWAVDGRAFSDRIWSDRTKLIETVNQELTRMVATGEAPDKAIEAIAKQFNVSKQNAGRVVMTESAYFASAAQKDCFEDLGVEQYQVIGALDRYTCEFCGAMDSKIFKMSEYLEGSTAPPFHPWCRCCTAPYFADMEGLGERYARDIETGKAYKVPGNSTYEQWKQIQDDKYGSGTVDRARKMHYNEKADRAQYERYKDVLGDNAPKSFRDFQELKYSENWSSFKSYGRAVKGGELSPLAGFDLYLKTSKEIDDTLVGTVTSNGIAITGKSNHFICRVIGSVSQRRSGVTLDDVIDALSRPETVDGIRSDNNVRSQRFKGKKCFVTVNPDTGNLIQVNPRSKGGKKKNA